MTAAASSIAAGTDDLLAVLRASPTFDALPLDSAEQVAKATRVESFPAGATILRQEVNHPPRCT